MVLAERAVQDESPRVRSAALETLIEKWPDETTRKLLEERAVDASLSTDRRDEHCIVFGQMHSEFGRYVLTRRPTEPVDKVDPAKPISREHIMWAAEAANVPDKKIDEMVRSLSEHLGWDITQRRPLQRN